MTTKDCESYLCQNNINSASDLRRRLLDIKKNSRKQGVHDFESNSQYITLTRCKPQYDDYLSKSNCKLLQLSKQKTPKENRKSPQQLLTIKDKEQTPKEKTPKEKTPKEKTPKEQTPKDTKIIPLQLKVTNKSVVKRIKIKTQSKPNIENTKAKKLVKLKISTTKSPIKNHKKKSRVTKIKKIKKRCPNGFTRIHNLRKKKRTINRCPNGFTRIN